MQRHLIMAAVVGLGFLTIPGQSITPNSCLWCVAVEYKWNMSSKKCESSGTLITPMDCIINKQVDIDPNDFFGNPVITKPVGNKASNITWPSADTQRVRMGTFKNFGSEPVKL